VNLAACFAPPFDVNGNRFRWRKYAVVLEGEVDAFDEARLARR